MKVIGVTGMPGSGKGVVSGAARGLGFTIIRMGDIIREEARNRNADIGETAVKLRQEYGEFIVAQRCVEKIKKSKNKHDLFMIEGIRSPFEVKIFKENFPGFKVITVHSTPHTRFKRLQKRMRLDDSREKSEFHKRDERELRFGIGNVIATSEYMVVNEGAIKKFKNIVRSILQNEIHNES